MVVVRILVVGIVVIILVVLRVELILVMFVVVVVSVFGVVNINDILYFFLVYYVVVVVGGLFRCWFFMDGIVIGCDLCFILLNCWCWMVDGVLSLVWCYCCVYGVKVG